MKYKHYFVVAGGGESDTSKLNAFDRALIDAGIAQCNLVPVSSILPEGAVKVEPLEIPAGSITHCVMARQDGVKGETVSAGIGWAQLDKYGIVAEDKGNTNGETTEHNLRGKIMEMSSARRMKPRDIRYKTATQTIKKQYGTVVAALIYVE
jgi:arginine decarboxylase